jgi:hypothetical protein
VNTISGVGEGLHAALLLARGRADGLQVLSARDEPTGVTAIRSFWAAALCLPAFVCLQLIDLAVEPRVPPHAAHGLALQLFGYVIDWAGFALLTHWLAGRMGRAAAWPRFIAAWNWCNVVQYLLLVAAALPPLLGLPEIVGETAWLTATGWALWIKWYATRLALEVNGVQATGIVLLDQVVAFVLLATIQTVTGGLA